MSLDRRILDAIADAVREADQPTSLAKKISAWAEAIYSGNEDVNDPQSWKRHSLVLYDAVNAKADED